MTDRVVRITLKDGLMLPGFTAPASYTCVIFCRVPPDWLDGARLGEEKLEVIYESLYGPGWRAGNEDGSRYVVLDVDSRVLEPDEEQSAPWRDAVDDDQHHYWFYHASGAGGLQAVSPAEL